MGYCFYWYRKCTFLFVSFFYFDSSPWSIFIWLLAPTPSTDNLLFQRLVCYNHFKVAHWNAMEKIILAYFFATHFFTFCSAWSKYTACRFLTLQACVSGYLELIDLGIFKKKKLYDYLPLVDKWYEVIWL